MVQLDERLGAIAQLVLEAISDKKAPCVADVGCDHGRLTAHLLQRCERLSMIASDVSAPSLEKAKQLFAKMGFGARVSTVVADGLGGVDRPVDVIVMAGMGAETILKIISEGREKIDGAKLIMQANVDLPMLRRELAAMGCAVESEVYSHAAVRRYVTLLACAGEFRTLDDRARRMAVRRMKDRGSIFCGSAACACARWKRLPRWILGRRAAAWKKTARKWRGFRRR